MSPVTTERALEQCNGGTLKAFKQWKDIIGFQKIAMAVEWSMIWRGPILGHGNWLGNGYIIQTGNNKLR